jgi:transcriptional regulator with XRE-family HTH domain
MITEHDDTFESVPYQDVLRSVGIDPDAPWTLGRQLRVCRRAEEWSLNELSDRVGCSPQRLSDYEHGRRVPSFQTAIKLAEALGFSRPHLIQLVIEEQLKREGLNLQEVGLYFSQTPKSPRKAKSS